MSDLYRDTADEKENREKKLYQMQECIQAARYLRCNENIRITKPDKGSGVVIMNKSDYISKMNFILQDNSKFENLGPSFKFDNTAKIEAHIQRRLL